LYCTFILSAAQVVINEVADAGSGTCIVYGGLGYIELKNTGTSDVDLTEFVISAGTNVFAFPRAERIIAADAILVLCRSYPNSFTFAIGATDTVTLKDSAGTTLMAVTLTGAGTSTSSFQRRIDESYAYATPTPNAENAFQGM
jgi:hypothetical protein